MRRLLPFPGRKPPWPTVKLKLRSTSSQTSAALPDLLYTSLLGLKESADAFPPLKSAVGGVLAVWDIAERTKHSKSDARDIALRTEEILNVIADAVPDGSAIPPPMLQSIQGFVVLLDQIRCSMEAIALTSIVSRLAHLNRNERALRTIKAQLDDAYRDMLAASALRVEAQQAEIAAQQAAQQTLLARQQKDSDITLAKIATAIETLTPDLSNILFYSRLSAFFGRPLIDLHSDPADEEPG